MGEIIDGDIVTTGRAGGGGGTDLAPAGEAAAPAKPVTVIEPRVGIRIREGTTADVAYIDRMQKAHSRELGFLPLMAIEGTIRLGQVLIAESVGEATQTSPVTGRPRFAREARLAPTADIR